MLAEHYELLEVIGEGVSARVYKAIERATGSVVAIKALNPHLRTDEISLERFRREVQITRLLQHPQIVSIYDLMVDEGGIYLVMEYLDGPNLKDFGRLHAPVPVETVLSIVRQILAVLARCHARNVIHRDLKPQNVIVIPHQLVKVVDFGISRMTTLADLTQTGTSLGSPEYMAPELFARSTYDPRTDLYAVGVIAFELLAGVLPFQGDSLAVLFRQHLSAPVARLDHLRADVPEWLHHLIERLLAKQPHERYQSADEALSDIDHRRVVAREMPALPKRECAHCGTATLAELPLCTFCGYAAADLAANGAYEVWCSEAADDTQLQHYVQTVLGIPLRRRPRRRALLFDEISELSAEVIKRSAARHGLYLTIRRRTPIHVVTRLATQAFRAVLLAVLFWTAAYEFLRLTLRGDVSSLALPHVAFLNQVAGLVYHGIVAALILLWYRRLNPAPLVRDPRKVGAALAKHHGWLLALVPALQAPRREPLRQLVSQMIEKFLLLRRALTPAPAASPPPPDVAVILDLLERLLQNAVELAAVISELENGLDAAGLAAARQEGASFVAESADEAAVRQRRQDERLREYCELDERHARLSNTLIHLHAVFNGMLGRALVLGTAMDAAAVQILEQCLQQLGADVAIGREVEWELARSA